MDIGIVAVVAGAVATVYHVGRMVEANARLTQTLAQTSAARPLTPCADPHCADPEAHARVASVAVAPHLVYAPSIGARVESRADNRASWWRATGRS